MKIALLILSWACLSGAASDSESALAKLQASWDETKSYSADFTQTVKSKGTGMDEDPSSGTLSVVKPNKLRWEDKTAHTTQILNGKQHWEISENVRRKSRTVTHRPDVSALMARSALAILAGAGKFKDFYKVKLVSQNAKEAVLELIPKTDASETLIAKIDKNGYVLRSLTTDSADSKVIVEFHNIQRGAKFGDKLFEYEKRENDVFQTRKD
jgi:chaperone LolA